MASAGQGIPTGFRPQIPSSAFPPPGSSYGLPQSQTAQQQQQRGGAGGAVNSGVTGAGGVGAGVPPFPPSRTGSTPAGGAQGSSNQLPPPGSGPGSQAAQAFLGQPNRSGTGGYPFSSTGGSSTGGNPLDLSDFPALGSTSNSSVQSSSLSNASLLSSYASQAGTGISSSQPQPTSSHSAALHQHHNQLAQQQQQQQQQHHHHHPPGTASSSSTSASSISSSILNPGGAGGFSFNGLSLSSSPTVGHAGVITGNLNGSSRGTELSAEDFPALGSAATTTTTSGGAGHSNSDSNTSGGGGGNANAQLNGLTGGGALPNGLGQRTSQPQTQEQASAAAALQLQQQQAAAHRQNLLGAMSGAGINVARMQGGFLNEQDKRNWTATKQGNPPTAPSSQAPSGYPTLQTNGLTGAMTGHLSPNPASQQYHASQQQQGSAASHLRSPTDSISSALSLNNALQGHSNSQRAVGQGQGQGQGQNFPPQAQQPPSAGGVQGQTNPSNGTSSDAFQQQPSSATTTNPNTTANPVGSSSNSSRPLPNSGSLVPQTPAQQVLYSPADRFGLLGLLSIIKTSNPALGLLAMGSDLQSLGLNMDASENLSTSLFTPWTDPNQVASLQVEPDFHIPACYKTPAPGLPSEERLKNFSEELLFFIFYSQPRDVMQELAAQQLFKKNWRYHKELQLWLTKEAGTECSQKTATFERGSYVFFDPATWEKVSKEFVLVYDALEHRSTQSGVPTAGNPSVAGKVTSQTPGATGLAGYGGVAQGVGAL